MHSLSPNATLEMYENVIEENMFIGKDTALIYVSGCNINVTNSTFSQNGYLSTKSFLVGQDFLRLERYFEDDYYFPIFWSTYAHGEAMQLWQERGLFWI